MNIWFVIAVDDLVRCRYLEHVMSVLLSGEALELYNQVSVAAAGGGGGGSGPIPEYIWQGIVW